jgi:cysteine-rich repeat protein
MAFVATMAPAAYAQCGNGIVDPGEQCDTGFVFAADCCSALCQYDAPGEACGNEGNPCTLDACDGAGTCEHDLIPPGSCSPAASGTSTFQLKKNPENQSQEKLVWKWAGSEAVAKEDFGILGSQNLALCIRDANTVDGNTLERFSTNVLGSCGTKPCVKETTSGYIYRNPDDTMFGKSLIVLKSGAAGKNKIQLKGKGVNLAYLADVTLDAPLHIQFVRDATHCWEAFYSSTLRNHDKGIEAKSDWRRDHHRRPHGTHVREAVRRRRDPRLGRELRRDRRRVDEDRDAELDHVRGPRRLAAAESPRAGKPDRLRSGGASDRPGFPHGVHRGL